MTTTTTPSPGAGMDPARLKLFRWIMFGLLLLLAVGCAFLAEWGTRQYERNRASAPDYFPQIYYPHKRSRYGLVPNLDYYGWFKINSLGFRGREFTIQKQPGMFRIICLGASTTFDIGSIGKALPWPEVMENELRKRLGTQNIEVLNMGVPGSTSLDSLIDLQMRVLELKPDLLIVYQGHNDFSYSFPSTPDPDLYPLEAGPRSKFDRWLTNHSLFYTKAEGKLRAKLGGLFGGGGNAQDPDTARRVDASLENGYRGFADNMRSIAAIARANHIPLVLPQVILPFAETGGADCSLCKQLPSLFGNIDSARISGMFARYDAALVAIAAEGPGVTHLPTGGFVPSVEANYHEPIHFGPEGSKLMGVKMAEAMQPLVAQVQGAQAQTAPAGAN